MFVWSREIEWSRVIVEQCDVDLPKVALRTVCADSTAVRSMLASSTPRVHRIPSLIMVEMSNGEKKTSIVDEREAIELLLATVGIEVATVDVEPTPV